MVRHNHPDIYDHPSFDDAQLGEFRFKLKKNTVLSDGIHIQKIFWKHNTG